MKTKAELSQKAYEQSIYEIEYSITEAMRLGGHSVVVHKLYLTDTIRKELLDKGFKVLRHTSKPLSLAIIVWDSELTDEINEDHLDDFSREELR